MTLNEYQELAARTINPKLMPHQNEFHALTGLVAEVGELHEIYQKDLQGHKFNEEHFLKECGDILWMLSELLTAKGYTLDDVARMNIDKLKARYPDGFDTEHSIHRDPDDI